MKKKLGLMLLAGGLFWSSMQCAYAAPISLVYDGQTHWYDAPAISLYVNDEKIETKVMDPIQIDSRVLVPAREVFEPMGAAVNWDSSAQKVKVSYGETEIVLNVNSAAVTINNETYYLDVPAKLINDKIMIPIRFISENLGFDVQWESSTHTVKVYTDGTQTDSEANGPQAGTVTEEKPEASTPVVEEKPVIGAGEEVSGIVGSQSYIGVPSSHIINLPAESYAQTQIVNVQATEINGELVSMINASSPISNVTVQIQSGKIIIDIGNSISGLSNTITPDYNSYVQQIRTSQYTADTTRIVYDLKSAAVANINFNETRNAIYVYLSPQYIENIEVINEGDHDSIFFKGITASQLQVNETAENVLAFFINNMQITENVSWNDINANYIQSVNIMPNGSGMVGTINVNDTIGYEVTNVTGGAKLVLSKPTYANISYSSDGTRGYLSLRNVSINTASITSQDLYREKKWIIDLGGDYSSTLGYGTLSIGDGKLVDVTISTSVTTKLTITTSSIYALNTNDLGTSLQLEFLKPYEKYDKIVVLDPGHGGSDSGAVGNGLTEKEMNLNQFMGIYKLLESDPNIKVYTTRDSDVYPTLQYRTEMANDIGADLFISIHNNSAGSAVTGTETLYFPSTTDTRGQQVAQLVQSNIVNYCSMNNRGIKARSDLYVLRTSDMPAILIETGFISNASEAARINSASYISTWAQAVYDAINVAFNTIF